MEEARTEDGPRGRGKEQSQKGNEFQDEQWQNGGMNPAMVNGSFGFTGMNGMFPMDFSQIMANGMQMPMGGFPGMMSMCIYSFLVMHDANQL